MKFFNIFVQIVGIMAMTIALISILAGILRLDIKRKTIIFDFFLDKY